MTEQTEGERYIDYLVKLAAQNVCAGVIEEPRWYYNTITLLPNGVVSEGQRDVFRNGEQFPVRITHAAFALRPDFVQQIGTDERFIQRIGLRMTFHDQYYQARDFVPVPLWSNKVVAGPAPTSTGFITQTLDRPVILSARDSLRVTVALESTPTYPRRVVVAFTGIGLLSKRPYFFSSEVDLTNTVPVVLDTTGFRNDGAEPVALTDMVVNCGPEEQAPTGAGDVRQLRIQVRQVGNGTQADWGIGPTSPPLGQCLASLLGKTEGRAVIHRFPGDGLIWEPGEGIIVQGIALDASTEGMTLGCAMLGYISVT